MTAKNRRELKQLFRTGAQPTEQDYADVFDSAINQLDDGISAPPEPHLPVRIRGKGAGLSVLDLYDDDTHNWRISLFSQQDSGYNLADPSGNSHFFVEDGSGNVGLGVTKPKAKLHINQSDATGDALYIQDVKDDLTPTRVSNAGHLYVNSRKDGDDGGALGDASVYINGSLHLVDEATATSRLHVNQYGAIGINAEAEGSEPKVNVNTDVAITGNLKIDRDVEILGKLRAVGFGIVPIGTIQAWHKSLPGVPALPDGWVECNGQLIEDQESLLNNQYAPDLNNSGLFLRGSSTSGNSQNDTIRQHTHTASAAGAGSHSHTGSIGEAGAHKHNFSDLHYYDEIGPSSDYATEAGDDTGDLTTTKNSTESAGAHTHPLSITSAEDHSHPITVDNTGEAETRPANMSVVWIMRTK